MVFERMSTKGRRGFSLRMAPMIDRIFLLLIFFLVAAKWRPEEELPPFRLPAARAASPAVGRLEPLRLHVSQTAEGCMVRIDSYALISLRKESFAEDLSRLMTQTERIMRSQRRVTSDPMEIACEEEVSWDYVARIYNVLCTAGLSDITFLITE